jgi:hypothetical protein
MNLEELQLIASIAQSITTVGVLLVWVIFAEKRRIRLAEAIIDDWHDLRHEKLREQRQSDNTKASD